MNTKQQNVLRSLLKKYKYKNVSNMVRLVMGINYENFLVKAEPLYIIPRIASCYGEENKKKELMNVVYKEWLKDVVENRWVEPINDYSDEHGERIVLSAIYYLIDNGLWESYEGRVALGSQEADYYDKLSDMPSAIAMMVERQKEEDEQKEKEAQQNAQASADGSSSANASDAPQGNAQGKMAAKGYSPAEQDPILSAEDAVTTMLTVNDLAYELRQHIERLSNYVCSSADTDAMRKQIADLQLKLNEANNKYAEAQATMQKASDFIAELRLKLSAQKAKAQAEYDELNAKYKKALDERDAADGELAVCKKLLDEEANRQTLPKKKVIPYSVLDAVPLLGKGVMTGLVPVLAKYNVVVDYNK